MDERPKSIELPNGYFLIRIVNKDIGGYTYISDEVGGGVRVWDTALVDPRTLQAALEDYRGEEISSRGER